MSTNVFSPKQVGPAAPPPSLGVTDIYQVLFRRKWLILLFAAAGISGASLVYYLTPPEYKSEARLLVRYVIETKSVEPLGAAPGDFKSPDGRGENVVNSEIDI